MVRSMPWIEAGLLGVARPDAMTTTLHSTDRLVSLFFATTTVNAGALSGGHAKVCTCTCTCTWVW